MIFQNELSERIETPIVLFWEKAEEINSVKNLDVTILNADIRKSHRIIFGGVEYIVDSITETKDKGVVKELNCLSSEIELVNHYIEDKRPQGNADAALGIVLHGTRFRVGECDDLGVQSLFLYQVNGLEALGELCQVYGCEYSVSIKNGIRYINLHARIGKDLGKRIHYTKDLDGIKRTIHSENICTRLYVYGKGEESGDGWGRRISIDSVNDGKKYLEDDDLRQQYGIGIERLHRIQKVIFDDIEDPAELKTLGQAEFDNRKEYKVSYVGDILNLGKMGLPHENVELGDTVVIYDEDFLPPIEITARVRRIIETSTTQQKIVSLGNYRDAFTSFQKNLDEQVNNLKDKSAKWDVVSDKIEHGEINYLEGVLDAVNAELDSEYGHAKLIAGRGLVVPNRQDESEATSVVEVGGGFIRFANSRKSNGEWDYKNISDGNGVIASSITTGILKGGKVNWNLETGTFLIGNSVEDYNFFYDGTTLRMQNVDIDISNNEIITELQNGLTSAQSSIEANATEIATKISKTQILTDTEIQEALKGEKGDKGEDAPEKYTWYRWADTPTSGISGNPLNKDYLGIAYNKPTPTPSDNYDDYEWVLVKGERGADGVSPDDKFFWVKYADDDKGTGMSDSPVGKRWLGVAENKDTSMESNDYRDYKWSPLYDNSVIIKNTAPSSPNIAQLWLDTSVNPNLLKRWTGEEWETISDTTEIQNLISTKADAETVDQQLQNIVDSVNNTIESQIQQTNETFDIRFTDIIEAVDEAGNRIDELSDEIETNIRFTADGMEMGKSTNPISMKLMPDRLGFWENGIEIAYFSNDTLFVNNLHAKESVRIGPVAWVLTRDANENVTHISLRKVT